ncbi:MAG: LysR family transcriptional regulator, partial [Bacillota bacterium]|nr:LysR family transcriptional regulator [Bacillota bacterium]
MINTDLFNFTVVAEDLNITNAAAKLFITQQTLSEQIKRLEKTYDAVFFVRKPVLKLTPAGERMLIYAKKVLQEESLLTTDLAKLTKKGPLSIGYSGTRGATILSASLPELSMLYPENGISLISANAQNLLPLLQSGEIDAFMVCGKDYPKEYRVDVLYTTKFLYFCKKKLFHHYYDEKAFFNLPYSEQLQVISKIPFSTIPKSYPLRNTIDCFFKEHNLTPNYISAATSASMNVEICRTNKAGIVLPVEMVGMFISKEELDDFVILSLDDMPELEPQSFVSKKDQLEWDIDTILEILKQNNPLHA